MNQIPQQQDGPQSSKSVGGNVPVSKRNGNRRKARGQKMKQAILATLSNYPDVKGKTFDRLAAANKKEDDSLHRDVIALRKQLDSLRNTNGKPTKTKTRLWRAALNNIDLEKMANDPNLKEKFEGRSALEQRSILSTDIAAIRKLTGLSRDEVLELMAADDFGDFLNTIGGVIGNLFPPLAPVIGIAKQVIPTVGKMLGFGRNVGNDPYDRPSDVNQGWALSSDANVIQKEENLFREKLQRAPTSLTKSLPTLAMKVKYKVSTLDTDWLASWFDPVSYGGILKPTNSLPDKYFPATFTTSYSFGENTGAQNLMVFIYPEKLHSTGISNVNSFLSVGQGYNPSTGSIVSSAFNPGPLSAYVGQFSAWVNSTLEVTLRQTTPQLNVGGTITATQIVGGQGVLASTPVLTLGSLFNQPFKQQSGKEALYLRQLEQFTYNLNLTSAVASTATNLIAIAITGIQPGATFQLTVTGTVAAKISPSVGTSIYGLKYPNVGPATAMFYANMLTLYPFLPYLSGEHGTEYAEAIRSTTNDYEVVMDTVASMALGHRSLYTTDVPNDFVNFDLVEPGSKEISFDKMS